MRKPSNPVYLRLRTYLDSVPVVDSHEHYFGGAICTPIEVMPVLMNHYAGCDLCSVSPEMAAKLPPIPRTRESFEADYALYESAFGSAGHTAYNHVILRGLKECWGVEDVSHDSLIALQKKLEGRDETFLRTQLDKYKIRAQIVDTCDKCMFPAFVRDGGMTGFPPECKFAFPLPDFHCWNQHDLQYVLQTFTGLPVNNLDEVLVAFEQFLKACVDAGAICMKDQSAYGRKIRYDKANREDAEAVLQKHLRKEEVSDEERITLSNWLMREYMRLAAKYQLPVQLHTGEPAGLGGEIRNTNAIELTSLIADNGDVHFDLFHGNWPYMDELLFLGKNYPNVSLDLCWVQTIDPLYSVELMKRVVMTMPHTKLIAYGGDDALIEHMVGSLCLARDNVAYALTELIECDWITEEQAKQIACDWFFHNPNRIFRLGLKETMP